MVIKTIIHKLFGRECKDCCDEIQAIQPEKVRAIIDSNPDFIKYFFQSPFVRDILEDTAMVKSCILSSPLTAYLCSLNPSFRNFIEDEKNIAEVVALIQDSGSYVNLGTTRKMLQNMVERSMGAKLIVSPDSLFPPSPPVPLFRDVQKQIKNLCTLPCCGDIGDCGDINTGNPLHPVIPTISLPSITSSTPPPISTQEENCKLDVGVGSSQLCGASTPIFLQPSTHNSFHTSSPKSLTSRRGTSTKVREYSVSSQTILNPWSEARSCSRKRETSRYHHCHHYRNGR